MTLLALNASDVPDPARLARALAELPEGAPVVVMIHGMKFDPATPEHSPHGHILSLSPDRSCWKAKSWPRRLGLGDTRGLAIAFGWPARGPVWQVTAEAARAARSLAAHLSALRRLAPRRPVHMIAHSLGARVALRALAEMQGGDIQRVVLLSGAVFRAEAARVMETPAGRTAEVISVQTRENRLFDALLRAAYPLSGPTLGHRGPARANWLDLPLDRARTTEALARLGHPLGPHPAPICHWATYLRPGVWRVYRALLTTPERLPLAVLRTLTTPDSRPRRWLPPLPFPGRPAT